MKNIVFVLLVAIASACSSTKHTATNPSNNQSTIVASTVGADGSSFEKAIVIQETNESSGVDAEYKWIRENYPGSKTGMQALNMHDKKPYDVLTITTANGTEKKIYFDISNFFGKI